MRISDWSSDVCSSDLGLRPTRQRLALAKLLFEAPGGCDRHMTAEQLHAEAVADNVRVSLATIYNSLHQFTEAGLLREVVVESGRSYFDTNVTDHHHLYYEGSGRLQDIPGELVPPDSLPTPPAGATAARAESRRAAGRERRGQDVE